MLVSFLLMDKEVEKGIKGWEIKDKKYSVNIPLAQAKFKSMHVTQKYII